MTSSTARNWCSPLLIRFNRFSGIQIEPSFPSLYWDDQFIVPDQEPPLIFQLFPPKHRPIGGGTEYILPGRNIKPVIEPFRLFNDSPLPIYSAVLYEIDVILGDQKPAFRLGGFFFNFYYGADLFDNFRGLFFYINNFLILFCKIFYGKFAYLPLRSEYILPRPADHRVNSRLPAPGCLRCDDPVHQLFRLLHLRLRYD